MQRPARERPGEGTATEARGASTRSQEDKEGATDKLDLDAFVDDLFAVADADGGLAADALSVKVDGGLLDGCRSRRRDDGLAGGAARGGRGRRGRGQVDELARGQVGIVREADVDVDRLGKRKEGRHGGEGGGR